MEIHSECVHCDQGFCTKNDGTIPIEELWVLDDGYCAWVSILDDPALECVHYTGAINAC